MKTGAMRSIALMFNFDWSDKAWGYFLDSVKTGGTAFEKAHGMSVSDWKANEVIKEIKGEYVHHRKVKKSWPPNHG